jgi:hypothetical protein
MYCSWFHPISLWIAGLCAIATLSYGCSAEDPAPVPEEDEAFPYSVYQGTMLADPVITEEGFVLLAEIEGQNWLCRVSPPARKLEQLFELSELNVGQGYSLEQFRLQLVSSGSFFVSYIGVHETQSSPDYIGFAQLNTNQGITDVDTVTRRTFVGEPALITSVVYNPINRFAYYTYQSPEINLTNFDVQRRLEINQEIQNVRISVYDTERDTFDENGEHVNTGFVRQRNTVTQITADLQLSLAISGGNLQNENLPTQILEFDFTRGVLSLFTPEITRLRDDLNIDIRYISQIDDPAKVLAGSSPSPGYLVYGRDFDADADYIGLIRPGASDTAWALTELGGRNIYVTDFVVFGEELVVCGFESSIRNAAYRNWPEVYGNPDGGGFLYAFTQEGEVVQEGTIGDFSATGETILEFNEDGELTFVNLPITTNSLYLSKMFSDREFLYLLGATRSNQVYNDMASILVPISALIADTSGIL